MRPTNLKRTLYEYVLATDDRADMKLINIFTDEVYTTLMVPVYVRLEDDLYSQLYSQLDSQLYNQLHTPLRTGV